MSRRCTNPGCFSRGSNDAGPPEYVSNNAVECLRCDKEIDLDDDEYEQTSDGDYLCEDCLDESEVADEEEDE